MKRSPLLLLAGLVIVGLNAGMRTGAAASPFQPLIVNGTPTTEFPSTGAFLQFTNSRKTVLYGLCSGTLIGCRTFVTAAHCVCSDSSDSFSTCQRDGVADPSTLQILLQNGGLFDVAAVAVNPAYVFAEAGDVAVLTLADAVTGIAPSAINTTVRPAFGSAGTIVGFGTTSGGRHSANDDGIKRVGEVTTASCTTGIPDATHLCWQYSGTQSNTCEGDSGGPLFVDLGNGPVLAGLTSGGDSETCGVPDMGFDTDIFVNQAWIESTAGDDIGTTSCDLPAVGDRSTTVVSSSGALSEADPQAQFTFAVAAGTAQLRVVLNGQFSDANDDDNDFNLYVRAGAVPTIDTYDCYDDNPTTVGVCTISAPAAGTWYALVDAPQGSGNFQVTATMYAGSTAVSCVGDCNLDGMVTIDELVIGVDIALGVTDLQQCPAFDANQDGVVTVDELITAVANALGHCPAS